MRLALSAPLRLPTALLAAARRFRRSDLVYVNTSVVIDHAVVSRFFPGRAILHVHEIPERNALFAFRILLRWSKARIVFNSKATRNAFDLPPSATSCVIYNGIAVEAAEPVQAFDGIRPLRVLMLGRISRIKGQEVLIEAVARLPRSVRQSISVRIVGNAFEDEAREDGLRRLITEKGLDGVISLLPFVADPTDHYRWADVVAVPSRRPESLGRVAIEAMAHGRPPIVSAIGGLTEIVEDGSTGWVVPPGDIESLADALAKIIRSPVSWRHFPQAAHARYLSLFSEGAAAEKIAMLIGEMLAEAERDPARGEVIAAVK
ncbi:glycosyltransferase family 4 protein [Aurantimonas sp. VKM B-3413]|uniref:glycosyltransferase family 4 protein n=1 Tax=Aurantimonas sp. VKM B-3413 TaxID=2779401 RepID=UPI001E43C6E8|nr:glycosyltransferase family 4 protein [Aurantimonas sp. VKM B-3413]MCB8840779.1 glycosyltransferase family 4 protein [Aurantimonas sp. VKM B-3413]